MIIKSAEFDACQVEYKKFPNDGLSEIVLFGRSNVGKSSFINTMLNRKGLARTSSQPGKTRTVNFYLINNSFRIVDMPGYGYAKTSKTEQASFAKMIDEYLSKRDTDFMILQLIDLRHEPMKADIEMYEKILSYDVMPVFIGTKVDKLKNSERAKNIKAIKNILELEEDDMFIPFSSVTGEGRDKTWKFLEETILS